MLKDLQVGARKEKIDVGSSFKTIASVPKYHKYLLRVRNGSCRAVLLQEAFEYTYLTM